MSTYLLRKGRPSEDAFTGMLADLMAWWPDRALVALGRARRFNERGEPGFVGPPAGVDVRHSGQVTIEPWPSWPSGEPDIVVEFWQPDGSRTLLIIEAKLGAAKSSADEGPQAPEPRDQLAKYWRDAMLGRDRSDAPVPSLVEVVYLTHHVNAPLPDLQSSVDAMLRTNPRTPPVLYWLSWADVETSMRLELERAEGAYARAIRSAADVLASADFLTFTGVWSPEGVPALAIPLGWRFLRSWSGSHVLPPPPGDPIFWRTA